MKNQVMNSKAVAKKPIASRLATKNSLKALAPKWRNTAISGAVGAGIGFAVTALSSSAPIALALQPWAQ